MATYEFKHLGFVVVSRKPYPFFGLRFLRWYMSIKPTSRELFSQRHGMVKTIRLFGLSAGFRRVSEYPSPTTQTEE